ncbi:MAG: DnaJ domain-containing protein [Nitrospinota bacterium]|nr:DnaJ domain-containing protein [Nitrospinota bacterium]MDH5679115.1 DnaJ domain-containing protein [Nitrospinota bacterium]MDH5756151.1 DnaJ domain-containing protein [Nitrospinota bacterium]
MDDPFSQWRTRRKELETLARKILGVQEGASLDELKAAYRQHAKATHPDTNPEDADSHEKFLNVKAAFLVLAKGKEEVLHDISQLPEPAEMMDPEEYLRWWVKKWG